MQIIYDNTQHTGEIPVTLNSTVIRLVCNSDAEITNDGK